MYLQSLNRYLKAHPCIIFIVWASGVIARSLFPFICTWDQNSHLPRHSHQFVYISLEFFARMICSNGRRRKTMIRADITFHWQPGGMFQAFSVPTSVPFLFQAVFRSPVPFDIQFEDKCRRISTRSLIDNKKTGKGTGLRIGEWKGVLFAIGSDRRGGSTSDQMCLACQNRGELIDYFVSTNTELLMTECPIFLLLEFLVFFSEPHHGPI